MRVRTEDVRNGLTAAAIAVVIWLASSLLFDDNTASQNAFLALVVAIIAFVGTIVIGMVVRQSHRR